MTAGTKSRIGCMGIRPIAPGSPWQELFAERRCWKPGIRRCVSNIGFGVKSSQYVAFGVALIWSLEAAIQCGFASGVAVILGCMEFSRPPLVVTFELSEKRKAI